MNGDQDFELIELPLETGFESFQVTNALKKAFSPKIHYGEHDNAILKYLGT